METKTIYGNLGVHTHIEKLEELAKKQVGDGKLPNKYYISVSNQILRPDPDNDNATEYYPAAGTNYRSCMVDCVDSLEDAEDAAEAIILDFDTEVCSVQIEDRLTGQVYERTLEQRVKIEYKEVVL